MVSTRRGKSLPPRTLTPPAPSVASTATGPDSQADPKPDAQFLKSPPTAVSSLSVKSVILYDWWLMKPQGNKNEGLAVGGFASRGGQEVRAFCSAEISKRHNTTTLETMDGIMVIISNFINRSRTHSYGFSLEICDYFMLGFPYNWEEYATQRCGVEAVNKRCPCAESGSLANCCCALLPATLDDLPVTKARDLLMSPLKDCERRTLSNHLWGKLSSGASRCAETAQTHNESNATRKCRDEEGNLDETPQTPRKAGAPQKCRDEGLFDRGKDVVTPRRVTRSMTRLSKAS